MAASPPPSMPQAEIDYQMAQWDDNISPKIMAVNVVCMMLASTSVILRLISRRFKATPLQADDYVIIAALVSIQVLGIEVILCAHYGMGRHMLRVAPPDSLLGLNNITAVYKLTYAIEVTWNITTGLVKLSVLLLFNRIFGRTSPKFRQCLILTATFAGVWTFGCLMATTFRCTPVTHYWKKTRRGHCIDAKPGRIATAVLNSTTDVIILMLPIQMVWKLMLPLKQKLAVAAIFGVGIFGLGASALRLRYAIVVIDGYDCTWHNASPILWAIVEPCVGIACACLPMLRPIFAASSSLFSSGSFPVRSWIRKSISISRSSQLPSNAEPKVEFADQKNPSNTLASERPKGRVGKSFMRSPFSTMAGTTGSGDSELHSFAAAPRSPIVSASAAPSYAQDTSGQCGACGGTGHAPPVDPYDVEKGTDGPTKSSFEVTQSEYKDTESLVAQGQKRASVHVKKLSQDGSCYCHPERRA